MPGRPHHTEKFKRCIDEVEAKGGDVDPYAVCTASLQKAGEPIFEGMESRSAEEFRALADPTLRAACGCDKGGDMKVTSARPEVIASLVTDKFSGFKDGDEAILEACSDTRLDEFRSASEQRKAAAATMTRLETENRNISARLTVAEARIKEMEAPLSEEEFMNRAPASIKGVIDGYRAMEAQERGSYVSQLKERGIMTEEELNKKSLDELRTLGAFARVEVPDFSGRGLPVERNASKNPNAVSYAPPDPYERDLKRMRAAAGK